MAAGITASANITELIPEITLEAEFIFKNKALGQQLVDVKNISGQPGTIVEFPIFTEVSGSASPAENAAPTSHQMDLTMPTLTVARRAINVHLSDLAEISASGNIVADIGHAMGMAKAKQDDVAIFSVLTGTTNYATSAGATNAATSITNIMDGLNLLELNEVEDDLVGVLHPFQYKSIRSALTPVANDDGISVAQASQSLGGRMVSQLFGAQWFVTNRISSGTVGVTANVYGGLLFTKKAIGYATKSKINGIEPDRSAETALTKLVWNYFDKAGVIRPDGVCKIQGTSA